MTIRIDGRDPEWVTGTVVNAGSVTQAGLAVLFDPFQPGRPRDRSGGLGLGLFIGREIVVAHGGTLEATSNADVTTFLLRLPRGSTGTAVTTFPPPSTATSGTQEPVAVTPSVIDAGQR